MKNDYLIMAENWVNDAHPFADEKTKKALIEAYLHGIDKGLDLALFEIKKIK